MSPPPSTTKRPSRTSRHVAFLRGINVGGKHALPMARLVEHFEAAGCTDVRTYIQSGNVVFGAPADLVPELPALVGQRISDTHGFEAPIVLRSARELQALVAHNPYVHAGAPVEHLHVYLLADTPSPERLAALDPPRHPSDTFTVVGRDVYLCLPNGMARTKLTNATFDRALATVSTGRNWRTLQAVLELTTSG